MTRSAAVFVVLAATSYVRADGGFIPSRYVPVRVTLEVRDLPADTAVFLVDGANVRRITPGETLEFRADRSGIRTVLVYSVPTRALVRVPFGQPDVHWMTREENPDCRRVGMIGLWGRIDVFDSRSVSESAYRLETTPDGLQLVYVSSNAPVLPPAGVCCALGLAVPAATVWLGIRLARRLSDRSKP